MLGRIGEGDALTAASLHGVPLISRGLLIDGLGRGPMSYRDFGWNRFRDGRRDLVRWFRGLPPRVPGDHLNSGYPNDARQTHNRARDCVAWTRSWLRADG